MSPDPRKEARQRLGVSKRDLDLFDAVAEHHHTVHDANGKPPPAQHGRLPLQQPIHCVECGADEAALLAYFRGWGMQVSFVDGWIVLDATHL